MEWRARRWRELLNRIDHLPRNSAFGQALAQDERLAALMIDADDSAVVVRRMADWSPEVELLTVLGDKISELTLTVAASAGVKPGRLQPLPRPALAVDRLRRQRSRAKHAALVARVLPKEGGPHVL